MGGHVEALETGVYRADFEYDFDINPDTVSKLIRSVDQDLAFALEVENGVDRSEVSNYEEVRQAIIEKLEMLRDTPKRHEKPFIYHLDVAAMYPNIILTIGCSILRSRSTTAPRATSTRRTTASAR